MRKYGDYNISKKMFGFLIGAKLGDGALIQRTINHNTYICFKHAENQYEYLKWKYSFLLKNGVIRNKTIRKRNFTKGQLDSWQDQYYFSTISLKEFNYFKKITNNEAIHLLDEFSLSIWILDDGGFYGNACTIGCARFSKKEREELVRILKTKFDLDSYSYEHPEGKTRGYVRIRSTEYKKVKCIVFKNIDKNIDVIKYKFKE